MTSAGTLEAIGFDDARRSEAENMGLREEDCGRIIRIDRGWTTIQRTASTDRIPLEGCPPLAVGDWVAFDRAGTMIRLERTSSLVRRAAMAKAEAQFMAVNVDLVVIVIALDSEISPKRLQEFVVLARDSGAQPLIVLTKSDVGDGPQAKAMVSELLADVDVIAVNMKDAEGIEEIRRRVTNRTVVLLGASGAGKSTLTNELLGEDVQETGGVKASGEGRHTTTARHLVALPGGGAIIDSPGIRSISPWTEGEGVAQTFPELDELAQSCRFSDCTHLGIAGCALDEAVDVGSIDATRRDLYLRFLADKEAAERDLEARDERLRKRRDRRRR